MPTGVRKMNETIYIKSVEEALTRTQKPYFKVHTEKKTFSVFDATLGKVLKENLGKSIEVELIEQGGYLNITKFIKTAEVQPTLVPEKSGNTIDENARLRRELDARMKALEVSCQNKQALTPAGQVEIAEFYLKFLRGEKMKGGQNGNQKN